MSSAWRAGLNVCRQAHPDDPGLPPADVTNGQRRRRMPDYTIGTREQWQAARDELAKLEAEHAKLGQKVAEERRQLPWVPVEKEYHFDTEDGKKTLAELFEGRSQLLAYNIMFGPDYEVGACRVHQPGGRTRRRARPPEPPRRDADLLLAGADRAPGRLQAADGLAVPLRLHLRDRLPLD